jgi:hypothetical protein
MILIGIKGGNSDEMIYRICYFNKNLIIKEFWDLNFLHYFQYWGCTLFLLRVTISLDREINDDSSLRHRAFFIILIRG